MSTMKRWIGAGAKFAEDFEYNNTPLLYNGVTNTSDDVYNNVKYFDSTANGGDGSYITSSLNELGKLPLSFICRIKPNDLGAGQVTV